MTTERYDMMAENQESTVVAHYERPSTLRESHYQSEAELERELVMQLQRQGYEYVPVHDRAAMEENLRRQLERLNGFRFSDGEWARFFRTEIAADGKDVVDKTKTIQKDAVKAFVMDDGEQRNVKLLDTSDIHANSTQVINQYATCDGTHPNRYDVTILVNGLPLVHIELKRRGVSLKEAFNQIERYGRESFWSGDALYDYVQVFVISNGTQTKYYSNTTRREHVRSQGGTAHPMHPRKGNSFEFTSYWADAANDVIPDLTDFTATFFSRHTLLAVLTKYCVLTEQNQLLVMRPYQIAATELLLRRVEMAHNLRRQGSREAGGYVWHTTGSGKTLTSFKAAQLASRLGFIDKVLFVVDRKDLDYQTMREYDRFQKGAANGNRSTRELQRQLEDPKCRIIITTIQKLSVFVQKNRTHEVYGREVVMIFDECHRSQFGKMHTEITRRFKKYYIFGFTGTPIFQENISPAKGILRTTSDVFGDRLHCYSIVDAIRDRNVLPFRVHYVKTMDAKKDVRDEKVWGIETESSFMDARRVKMVTEYVLDNFSAQTKRNEHYLFSKVMNVSEVVRGGVGGKVEEIRRRMGVSGFNAIFAVQSIALAKLYYAEFMSQMQELPENRRLKVAVIFSYAPNEEVDGCAEENSDSTEGLDQSSRDFLDAAIEDYNNLFSTSYDTSSEKFPNYYKDVSMRMKNKELDLLIVVNMFLTGFDATTLNTLWVDKNLRYHGLLQAFSRTNRILNSVKTYGNIVCFRNLEDETNKALALFGDRDARGVSIIRPFGDYFHGYNDSDGKPVAGYEECVSRLKQLLAAGELPAGEKSEREFIKLFGGILRMRNLLSCFEEFTPEADPLSERDLQDYTSVYNDLYEKYKNRGRHDSADISEDIEFEMELVKQVEVNIDYILFLVRKYHEGHCTDAEVRVKIDKSVAASPDLRDKKELIDAFIDSLTPDGDVDKEWSEYVNRRKREEYGKIIEEERLRGEKAIDFIEDAFKQGYVPDVGLGIDGILPPTNPFDRKVDWQGIKSRVVEKLKGFFSKFYGIANGVFR